MGVGQLKFPISLPFRHQVRPIIQRIQLLIWKIIQLNDDSVQTPRRNPSTSKNITLPVILRRGALFVIKRVKGLATFVMIVDKRLG